MSIPEITHARTQLAKAEHEYAQLDSLVSGGIIILRNTLNPYEDDVKKLKVDEAFETLTQVRDSVHRMRELYKTIERIKQDIGN